MSVSQTEVTDSRSSSTLSLARIRPGGITNGTSKHSTSSCSSGAQSSSSGHKAQRSASTYHRQRRHSDFCKANYWWLLFVSIHLETLNLHKFSSLRTFALLGGPAVPGSTHPKRSPSGVAEGAGLREERLSIRKPSTNTVGSRSIPTPSSPMVSSAHNPNKSEIPDRRKEVNSTTVSPKGLCAGGRNRLVNLICHFLTPLSIQQMAEP